MFEIVTNLQQRGGFGDSKVISKALPYKGDLFRSYYRYDDNVLDQLGNKSFTEYSGLYHLDTLIIDIDGHKDQLELAQDKVKQVLNWLWSKDVDQDNVLVWFSGGGFHIHVAGSLFGQGFSSRANLPETVRDTAMSLFPSGDNIYYNRALIRVGYSYNTKRKLWKVPLKHDEIEYPIDEIKDIASSPTFRDIPFDKDVFEPVLESFVVQAPDKVKVTPGVELGKKDEFINVVTCMHKLYDRGPVQGRRHTDMLRLASWMRRSHIPEPVIVDALNGWAPGIPSNETEKIVSDVFSKDYRYGCNDPVRMEFCDSKCIYYARKDSGSSALTTDDMSKEMITFATTGGFSHYLDLQEFTNSNFKVYPGELVVISGESGLNKSTFAQQLSVSAKDHKIYYVTTEVSRKLMFRRFIQQALRMNKDDVMNWFSAGKVPPGADSVSHILIDDHVKDYNRFLDTVLELKPSVVVVDVIEDIGGGDSNENIAHNGPAFKAMAMQLDIIVIAVAHMRKSQNRRSNIKSNDDVKGSAAVIQKADKVLLIEGDPAQVTRRIRSSKARDEKPFSIDVAFDSETFTLNHV